MLKKSLAAIAGLTILAAVMPAHATQTPAFKVKTLEGRTLTDKNLRGSVVVLDFWATWCSPCRAVSKVMQKVHEAYAKRGVKVICIDVKETGPSTAEVKRYIATHHYTYPFSVENGSLDKTMNVGELPTVIVIGRKGTVDFRTTGFRPKTTEAQIDAAVKKSLASR